jgi:hypothetical protein
MMADVRSVVLVLRDLAVVVSLAALVASFALVFIGLPGEVGQMAREVRHGRYGFRRSVHTWRLIVHRTSAEDDVERRWQVRAAHNFRLWLWCLGVMLGAALASVALTKLASRI